MNSTHIKPAFTLLETLVALVILVMVLGSSTVAGRAMQLAAERSSDLSQMNALADESIANFQLFQKAARAENPTQDVAVALGITASTTTVTGAFYAVPSTTPRKVEDQGYQALDWCTKDNASLSCTGQVSPVGIAGTCGDPSNPSSTCSLQAVLNSSAGGELVAVRRTKHTKDEACALATNASSHRMVIDVSNPLSVTTPSTCLYPSLDSADWDFYVRTITISKVGGSGGCSLSDMPGCATDPTNHKGNTYAITVSLRNYLTNQSAFSRTTTVADYNPAEVML